MTNFWKSFELIEEPDKKDLEYRVYYDKSGNIKFYTMEDVVSNYEYIVIDKETYESAKYNVVIKDKKIMEIVENNISQKLVHSDEGIVCDKDDVSIVVENNGQSWTLRRYV